MPLGLTASADAKIHEKINSSGATTLVILKLKILKIVTYLEDAGLRIKAVSESIEIKEKDKRSAFLGMLLDTLGSSIFEKC